MSELSDFILARVANRDIVSLAYAGGSRPGSVRDVVVISLHDSYFSGREVGAVGFARKNYRLDRILWLEDSSGRRVEGGNVVRDETSSIQVPELDSLVEYADYLRGGLEQAGWHVHESEHLFGVGSYFKNGKPKKTPSIAITYCDRPTELMWDFDGNEIAKVERVATGRERPWRLDSWRFDAGRTYALLHHAVKKFLEEIIASDPSQAKGLYFGHGR